MGCVESKEKDNGAGVGKIPPHSRRRRNRPRRTPPPPPPPRDSQHPPRPPSPPIIEREAHEGVTLDEIRMLEGPVVQANGDGDLFASFAVRSSGSPTSSRADVHSKGDESDSSHLDEPAGPSGTITPISVGSGESSLLDASGIESAAPPSLSSTPVRHTRSLKADMNSREPMDAMRPGQGGSPKAHSTGNPLYLHGSYATSYNLQKKVKMESELADVVYLDANGSPRTKPSGQHSPRRAQQSRSSLHQISDDNDSPNSLSSRSPAPWPIHELEAKLQTEAQLDSASPKERGGQIGRELRGGKQNGYESHPYGATIDGEPSGADIAEAVAEAAMEREALISLQSVNILAGVMGLEILPDEERFSGTHPSVWDFRTRKMTPSADPKASERYRAVCSPMLVDQCTSIMIALPEFGELQRRGLQVLCQAFRLDRESFSVVTRLECSVRLAVTGARRHTLDAGTQFQALRFVSLLLDCGDEAVHEVARITVDASSDGSCRPTELALAAMAVHAKIQELQTVGAAVLRQCARDQSIWGAQSGRNTRALSTQLAGPHVHSPQGQQREGKESIPLKDESGAEPDLKDGEVHAATYMVLTSLKGKGADDPELVKQSVGALASLVAGQSQGREMEPRSESASRSDGGENPTTSDSVARDMLLQHRRNMRLLAKVLDKHGEDKGIVEDVLTSTYRTLEGDQYWKGTATNDLSPRSALSPAGTRAVWTLIENDGVRLVLEALRRHGCNTKRVATHGILMLLLMLKNDKGNKACDSFTESLGVQILLTLSNHWVGELKGQVSRVLSAWVHASSASQKSIQGSNSNGLDRVAVMLEDQVQEMSERRDAESEQALQKSNGYILASPMVDRDIEVLGTTAKQLSYTGTTAVTLGQHLPRSARPPVDSGPVKRDEPKIYISPPQSALSTRSSTFKTDADVKRFAPAQVMGTAQNVGDPVPAPQSQRSRSPVPGRRSIAAPAGASRTYLDRYRTAEAAEIVSPPARGRRSDWREPRPFRPKLGENSPRPTSRHGGQKGAQPRPEWVGQVGGRPAGYPKPAGKTRNAASRNARQGAR